MKNIIHEFNCKEQLDVTYKEIDRFMDNVELWECTRLKNGRWLLIISVPDDINDETLNELKGVLSST